MLGNAVCVVPPSSVMLLTRRFSLAWAELYLAFGLVFRRFNLAIHDTTDADMEFMDYAFMLYVLSKGLSLCHC